MVLHFPLKGCKHFDMESYYALSLSIAFSIVYWLLLVLLAVSSGVELGRGSGGLSPPSYFSYFLGGSNYSKQALVFSSILVWQK